MKRLIIVFFCVTGMISCNRETKRTSPFTNLEHNFQISFPIEPTVSKDSGTVSYGFMKTASFETKPINDDNLSYEVHVITYPSEFIDTLSTDEIYSLFNSSQSTNINSEETELINLNDLNILGYTGREFRWQNDKLNIFSRVRFYMVQNKMYLLSVNTSKENNFNISINNFFNSFELIDIEPNPEKEVISASIDKVDIYDIEFTGPTEIREQEAQTEYGKERLVMELFQPRLENDDNLAYMVGVNHYSRDITQSKDFDVENYYANVVQRALLGRQSTLISKGDITRNGISGIEMKESFKEGQIVINQQVFLLGDKQLSVQVMTIPENDENQSMKKFFKSLQILNTSNN